MFKIRVVAQEAKKKKSSPLIKTEYYSGDDPDLKIKEILRALIFKHGYTHIRLTVINFDPQIEPIEEVQKIVRVTLDS